MYWQYGMSKAEKQAERRLSMALTQQLLSFLDPLLKQLDRCIDKRLIRTLLDTVIAILLFRDRAKNLLLSELGAYIASPAHAPAGTKRLSNLLRSLRWDGRLIEHFLWQRATDRLEAMEQQGETPLVLWDESMLEKPESLKLEGLGSVRSSKGKRLTHIKPGFYQPPKGTIFVPGMQWLCLVLVGLQSPPVLAAMQWWTNRGVFRSSRRCEEGWWLGRCMHEWGRRVVHVFDRGFAGEPWLEECMQYKIRFVMRWPKGYMLRDFRWIKQKAWQITRGKRSQWKRQLYNRHLNAWVQGGVVVVPVTHPAVRGQFWLVVSRPGKGQLPWYLLTNEPIQTEEDAWQVVFVYARRWQIEMTWRYTKSELGFESPRLWTWQARVKLLLIASLAFAFLLSLLALSFQAVRERLLRLWCHRTGERYRLVEIPLYRVREALSFLWLTFPPRIPLLHFSG
jgi:hypothetical protein